MNEQMELLKERAEWHQEEFGKYQNDDSPYAQGAAQYHLEKAQEAWNDYGRLKAYVETTERWNKDVISLPGRALK